MMRRKEKNKIEQDKTKQNEINKTEKGPGGVSECAEIIGCEFPDQAREYVPPSEEKKIVIKRQVMGSVSPMRVGSAVLSSSSS